MILVSVTVYLSVPSVNYKLCPDRDHVHIVNDYIFGTLFSAGHMITTGSVIYSINDFKAPRVNLGHL